MVGAGGPCTALSKFGERAFACVLGDARCAARAMLATFERHDASVSRREAEEKRVGRLLEMGTLPIKGNGPLDAHGLPKDFFKDISDASRAAAEARFIAPPVRPATPLRILAGRGFASLGTLNITNYDDYVWADDETRAMFEREVRQREIGSMETTHALIRLCWFDTPLVFVSGLTDTVGDFNADVSPRVYAQNMAAAHNAGIAIAHLIPEIVSQFAAGKFGVAAAHP